MAGRFDKSIGITVVGRDKSASKTLQQVGKNAETMGSKMGKFGKAAAAAFAAAGAAAAAYAGKLLVDGVKAAIEDAAAQERLALTLRNVTGAKKGQIAAVEDYITKTSLATGVTDEQLRPSLERLARATGSVAKAQKLQSLALNVAAGSGKSLESVSNALGKAYEGNLTSLNRLGVGLTAAELDSMSFEQIVKKLSTTFGGQASRQADTFQGKMARLKVAFDEGKETVGSFVLDAITPLVTGLVNTVIPSLSKTAESLGQKLGPEFEKISAFVRDRVLPAIQSLWQFITGTLVPGIANTLRPVIAGLASAFQTISGKFQDNREKLQPLFDLLRAVGTFIVTTLAPAVGKVLGFAFSTLGKAIGVVIDLIANLVSGIDRAIDGVRRLGKSITNNPVTRTLGNVIDGFRAGGGPVSAGGRYIVGERGPELFVPRGSGTIIPNHQLGRGGMNVTVVVQGSVIAERDLAVSVRNQIAQMMRRQGANPAVLGVGR